MITLPGSPTLPKASGDYACQLSDHYAHMQVARHKRRTLWKRRLLRAFIVLAFAAAVIWLLTGCASPASKADFMNQQTHLWAGNLDAIANDTTSAIQANDGTVLALASNPRPTTQEVQIAAATAHADNVVAIKALSQIPPIVVSIDANSDAQTSLTDSEIAEVAKIKDSWAYKIGAFELSILIWLIILEAIHILAGAAALILPPPYASYASLISKLCNPLGWTTAILSHFQLNQAAAATTSAQAATNTATAAIAEMASDVKAWFQSAVPFTPPTEALIAKTAGVAVAAPEPAPPAQAAALPTAFALGTSSQKVADPLPNVQAKEAA